MKLTQTTFFRFLLCPTLFLVCNRLWFSSVRLTAFVLLIALGVSYVCFLRSSRTKWMRLIFVSFLIAVFLPIDVSLRNYPGPPRFVPLVMGLPLAQDSAQAKNGEVILGGCRVRGNEPRWVWVW